MYEKYFNELREECLIRKVDEELKSEINLLRNKSLIFWVTSSTVLSIWFLFYMINII